MFIIAWDGGWSMFEVAARRSVAQPPEWAARQRALFDLFESAVEEFVADYLGDDGEPLWPPEDHVGVDGYDDVIEGFYNWPLVYAMGGDESLLEHAQDAYEGALTRFERADTPHGHPMVVDEFEQCRDWFHLGEGNLYTYNMGLAAPDDDAVRERAAKFADMYLGDSELNNYDSEERLVRAPMNGSAGPEYSDLSAFGTQSTFGGYGADYRWASHGLPWRDLEFDNATELLDPDNEERLFEIYEERCSRGDVPLNLAISSLMTNAYLHTGDEDYREWVTEYLDAWRDRVERNDGIIPDNVGLSDEIGEYTNGEWYGGMYGWSWGGWHYVGVGTTTAAENATLLTGDRDHLDFHRQQLDTLIENGIEQGDTLYIPHKYGGEGDYHYNGSGLREDDGEITWRDGWYEFKTHRDDPYLFHLWYMSLDEADRERVEQLRDWGSREWKQVDMRPSSKHGAGNEWPWLAYLEGEFPEFPERVLEANRNHTQEHLDWMAEEGREPDVLNEDYLRDRNPVFHRGLLNLTMGAPQPVYYGGMVMAQVRHFDPERERPGLPEGVSALVESIDSAGIDLTLVNGGSRDREVVTQAGAYAEHEFTGVEYDGEAREAGTDALRVSLPSGTRVSISAEMDRFVDDPTYAFPWDRAEN